ncbi:hypothetical protein ADL22_27555 [Streptomyces sp. NRRL F-4489]|nr:hypothetical protein ADL22_27555 [Streptomyces sp. NRRL F-4489]
MEPQGLLPAVTRSPRRTRGGGRLRPRPPSGGAADCRGRAACAARYADADMPYCFLNIRWKWLSSRYPTRRAISVTDAPVSRSSRRASRSRSAVTKSMNRQPVCSRKLREKCHWLM